MKPSEHNAGLVRLMSSPDWTHYKTYLQNQFATAISNLRQEGLTQEQHGIFKGMALILEDQINLPKAIAKKMNPPPDPEGPVNLDTPPD